MRILIDGYNLLPATDFPDREQLIAALAAYRKSKGHEITVVFDGTHSGTGSGDRSFSAGIEVIYTPLTVTADDEIEKRLPRLDPSSIIVVSSDRRIQDAARRTGAVFVSSQEFARRLTAPLRRREETLDKDLQAGKKRGNPRRPSKEEGRRRRKLERL